MPLPYRTCVDVRVNAEGAVSRRGFLRRTAGGAAAVAGLRWAAAPDNHINLRVDYAWSRDGEAWYVSVGEAF